MGCTCERASCSQKNSVCTSLPKPDRVCISDYLGGNINQRVEVAHAEVHIYNSFCGHKNVGIYLAGANCQTLKLVGLFIYRLPCHARAGWELAPAQPTRSSAEVCHIFCLPLAQDTGLQHLNRKLGLTFLKTDPPDAVLFSENIFLFFFFPLLHKDSYM